MCGVRRAAQGETNRQYRLTPLSVRCRAARYVLRVFGSAAHLPLPTAGRLLDGCWFCTPQSWPMLLYTDDGGCARRDMTMQAEEGAAVGVRRQPSSALATMEECKTYRKTMLCSV